MWWYVPACIVVLVLVFIFWRRHLGRAKRFFTPAQEQRFLSLVMGFFSERNIPAHFENGVVHLGGEQPGEMGLSNIAVLCRKSPDAEWPLLIAGHFDTLLDSMRESVELAAQLHDFSFAREMLMLRLIDQGAFPAENRPPSREDLPGLMTYLALDLPTTVQSVSDEYIEAWQKSVDELFAIALENVRTKSHPTLETHDMHGVKMVSLNGEDFFIASHVLLLPEYPECVGPYGTLVSLPTRHLVVCHPIHDAGVIQAINMMMQAAHSMTNESVGALTTQLYWYRRDGNFMLLPSTITGNTVSFTPPEEFVDLLNTLSADAAEAK